MYNVVYIDPDILIIQDLHSLFERDFDYLMTISENEEQPINGAMHFVPKGKYHQVHIYSYLNLWYCLEAQNTQHGLRRKVGISILDLSRDIRSHSYNRNVWQTALEDLQCCRGLPLLSSRQKYSPLSTSKSETSFISSARVA